MNNKKESSQSKISNKSRQITTRRNLIKTSGAVGIFGVLGVVSASGNTVEIPSIKRGDEVVETFEVNRDWIQRVNAANSARSSLKSRYQDQDWYDSIGQSSDKQKSRIAGTYQHMVTVYVNNVDKVADFIPNKVETVRVEVAESKDPHLDDHVPGEEQCEEETGAYDCVPGGAEMNSCPTTTCIADDDHIISCAHTFGDCSENLNGEGVWSGGYDKKIGDVVDYDHDIDVALVDSSGSVDGIDNGIVGEGNADVVGVATEQYVDSLISDYETVHQMGVTTGKTHGYVDEKVETTMVHCNENDVEALSLDVEAASGDSGGPHYYVNNYNNISLLAPHIQHTGTHSHHRSYGPAGYYIQEETGWSIGATSSSC